MLSLLPHLTTILLKAYLQQFSFTWYIMFSYQEKIIRQAKRQITQFEETEQTLETTMAGLLEL